MESVSWSEGPPQDEWERHRKIITYLHPVITAAQLRELMILRGFRATDTMYKRQFKKWGLSKYTKAREKDRLIVASEHSLNYSTWQRAEFPAFTTSSSLSQASFSVTTANGRGAVDMRFLFRSVKTSCSYFMPDFMINEFSAAAGVFWRNIKQAIHLLRIASPTRAWSSLNEAFDVAGSALLAADIGSFVREILTTLCPVNTRACFYVRQQIIQSLTGMAQIKLGACHPITVVLQQLLFDSSTRDVSERCLAYMVEVATPSKDPSALSAGVKAQLSISRLLRKDGEFDSAMRIAQHAHAMAVVAFGHNSVKVCWALRQQEHICIDTENYMKALNICFSIMAVGEFDFAEVQMSTKEDIAHIYERLGDMGKRADWLCQAEENARLLWGNGVATGHIIDKINGLMTRGLGLLSSVKDADSESYPILQLMITENGYTILNHGTSKIHEAYVRTWVAGKNMGEIDGFDVKADSAVYWERLL
ncbi:hypothetical protein G7Y89_g13716 [Cudoniella acicularis]|uniref:Clr5 domain-containing protein n=1 Tax=Cudoniella acicularis TaxID=354080 RepID=A0A8H4R6Q3_9HELO|nr:hypothetical protein G7Y89_g13716 [Cudoniella acicularis]